MIYLIRSFIHFSNQINDSLFDLSLLLYLDN